MNKIAMLIILIVLSLVALAIDPVLAAIFIMMWLVWYQQHIKEFE